MFRVDDLKAIHKDINLVHNVEQFIYFMNVDPNIGKVKSVGGKFHVYLSVTLD